MINKSKFRRALMKSDVYLRHPFNVAMRALDLSFGMAFGKALSRQRKGNIASFHIGRCGSTVLGGLLNQHAEIFWDGEILTRYYWYKRRKYVSLLKEAIQDLQKKIISSRMNIAGKKYYGFETRFFQMELFHLKLPEYIKQLEKFGFDHFVILERRNYLKVAVSWGIAHKKLRYHQPISQKAKFNAITLDINNLCMDGECKPLISYLDEWDNSYRQAESLLEKKKTLKIIYEDDILNDPNRGYERICTFLDLEPKKVVVQHSRTNPFKISEILLNYNEVAGTRFEWMLFE